LSVYEKPFADDPIDVPDAPTPALPVEEPSPLSAAVERFRTCRWRKAAENGTPECCGHRDVLPITGANGFDAAAWCPTCGLYKLRRTPKKREYYDTRY